MAEQTMATRYRASPHPIHVRFDRFELDEANASLLCEGQAIVLPPTPFAVLCALVRQPETLFTKDALLDEVWGHRFVTESVLKTVVAKLRTVLGDDCREPRFIETVSRRGYRFIAPSVAIVNGCSGATACGAPKSPFIGREVALARLGTDWAIACGGKRMVVWVAGEPGIGKTTLIEHFVEGLGDVACVSGQCVGQYGTAEPYLPVLEALGELCRRDSAAAALLRAVAPTWLLRLPWLSTADEREGLSRELAGVGAERGLREVAELFDRYAERRPLLLVTQDLHWSDRSTIQLIDYIARRRGSARFMWLASFRTAEVVALDHPLNAVRRELRPHGLVDEIVLDAFSEREVGQYVAQCSPFLASEAFVRSLHKRTDGLPLFVASVMNDVLARGNRDMSAASVARIAVPESLAAIMRRPVHRGARAMSTTTGCTGRRRA